MKTTVYNTMIGLMLASGLAMTSFGAMAQGRRPASTSSAAAAGNRSVATVSPKNNAAVNSSSTSVRSSVSSVSTRPSTSSAVSSGSRSSNSSASSIRPSVGGSNTSTTSRSNNASTVNRSAGSSTSIINSNAGNRSANRPNTSSVSSTITTSTSSKGTTSNNGTSRGNVRPNVGGINSGNSGNVNSNTGGSNNGRGHSTVPSSRPTSGTPRPKVGGSVMSGGGPSIDYNAFRYTSSWRPRFDGDRFFNSFRYNSWSWRNPIRPSVRPWRPSTMWVYRPIVTINISRYSSYPTIAGVLGLRWGTSFINSLNYLYYSGYEIDGFENNIVYLTDVELMNYDWDDVMLQFDGNDNLDYVEFAYWDNYYNTNRFYSLYNTLCSIYGSPVSYNNSMYSWYGGDGIGYVNLGMQFATDVCYTVLAFGV